MTAYTAGHHGSRHRRISCPRMLQTHTQIPSWARLRRTAPVASSGSGVMDGMSAAQCLCRSRSATCAWVMQPALSDAGPSSDSGEPGVGPRRRDSFVRTSWQAAATAVAIVTSTLTLQRHAVYTCIVIEQNNGFFASNKIQGWHNICWCAGSECWA